MPRGRRHYRITFADALSAHRRALESGGRDGVPSPELIDSAITRPYTGYYRSIARKTAALVESVATNHGFADGNKRTALILMHTLLVKSDYELVPLATDQSIEYAAEEMVMAIVNHKLKFEDLVAWFEARVRKCQRAP